MFNIDRVIIGLDNALRTLAAPAQTYRPVPGDSLPDHELTEVEKKIDRLDAGQSCGRNLRPSAISRASVNRT